MSDKPSGAAAPRWLRSTPFGEFVRRYTVLTGLTWWTGLAGEVERAAERGDDWELMVEERIAGLREFLDRRRREGEPRNWRNAVGDLQLPYDERRGR